MGEPSCFDDSHFWTSHANQRIDTTQDKRTTNRTTANITQRQLSIGISDKSATLQEFREFGPVGLRFVDPFLSFKVSAETSASGKVYKHSTSMLNGQKSDVKKHSRSTNHSRVVSRLLVTL